MTFHLFFFPLFGTRNENTQYLALIIVAYKLFIVDLLWDTSCFSSVYCGVQAIYCGFIVGNKLFIVDLLWETSYLLWEMAVFSSVYCGAQAVYCGLGSKMTFFPHFLSKK